MHISFVFVSFIQDKIFLNGSSFHAMVLMFRSARRLRRPSQFRDMMENGAWALRNLEEQAGLGRLIRGTIAVILICSLAPVFVCSYIMVSIIRVLWCRLLERRFPDIVVDNNPSVRAATDTVRNQGLVTLVLHVRGRCDINLIRSKFQEQILYRRGANGKLQFPRLTAALTSRWGHYAWRPCSDTEFQLDNHVVLGGQLFRGRVLIEANIQDYVSEIVSKCLPTEIPPWQLVLIPLASQSSEPRFYALLRLHHLLVDEVNAIHTVLRGDWGWGSPIVSPPRAIPYLTSVALGTARSFWLQQRHSRDPALNPSALQDPSVTSLIAALVFLAVDTTDSVLGQGAWYRACFLHLWVRALRVEAQKRHLDMKTLLSHVRRALSPLPLIADCARSLAAVGRITVQVPILFLRASRSAYMRTLANEALEELTFWTRVALDGPRLVFKELVRSMISSPPPIRSLCGRRVVVWSDPAPVELVERIASAAGATPVEVLLSAACGALQEHYRRQGCISPTFPVQALGASGVLLLSPHDDGGPIASLRTVSARIAAARQQPALLLASSWLRTYLTQILPSLSVRLLLNCVTRRYAATIMTVSPMSLTDPISMWGYTVDNVLIWRPPQSNISVSLSLVRLGSSVRLAVMADQHVSPHHAALPTAFLSHLRAIATALGVPRSPPPLQAHVEPGPSLQGLGRPANSEILRREEESLVDVD